MLLFASFLCSTANDTGDDNKKETGTIVPIVVTKGPQNLHRSLTPEIEAYYSNGCLVQNYFDASSMNVLMDIRSILTSGEYFLEFEFDNFDTYIGEFSI